MQTTSTDYKLEIKKPSRSFECKITIGNNIYTNDDIVDIILETIQPREGFSIGNTPSQTLDLTLLNRGDTIYSTSQVKVEIGLKIGSTIEYILMGYFNIDDIEKTDYTIKFTCYDNMIRFETPYFSSLTYPASLQQVINELATKTGVQFIGSLPAYTVKKLEGFTCREILGYVSSLCGGNALITRGGKFTIATPKDIDYPITPDNYIDYKREEVKYKIGKVSCKVGDKELNKGSLGTDSMEVKFENPWVTDGILNDIYTKLNGFEYLGYTMKWQGDISLDVGDTITCTDIKGAVRKIPILSQKFTYNGGLTAEIGAKGETKNKNSFNSSGSGSNKLDRVVTDLLIVNEALINKANIQDLEAVSIRTQTIEAKTAAIEDAIIDVAHVSDLTAINANIEKLIAADATMGHAIIGKANIADLNAANGKINILESSIGDIQTLVNGNLTSNNIQSLILTSDKVTVANGFIKNAMIENLNVSKINAGDISTNKFRIKSDNGGIEIVGATQQFKDKNNRVRIQMGQDALGNFNFILRGEDGTTTLIDHTGIKENAIVDDLIKGNMISENAVGGKQIDYNSFTEEFNKDTNTHTLKSSKVLLDKNNQTLDIAFNTLNNTLDGVKTTTESNTTAINVQQGKIATLISNTTIVKDGQTIQLKDSYNSTVATVNSINSVLGSHTSTIDALTGQVTAVDAKTNEVKRTLDGTVATVSSHSTQINGLNSTVSTQSSTIAQMKDSIALKVESTEVTNIVNGAVEQIGGSNLFLIKNVGRYKASHNVIGDTTNIVIENYTFNIIANPSDLLGCTIYNIKSKIIISGETNLTTLTPYYTFYKEDNTIIQAQRSSTVTVENGKFKFVLDVPLNAFKMEIGLGQYPYVAPYWLKNIKIEENIHEQITIVSDRVSTIETDLTGITSRVGSVEQTTTTINGNITSLSTRMNTAEQKITDNAIVSTVRSSTYYKNDLTGKVSSNEIISCINQTAESIKISASKINLTGYVTMTNLSTAGQTTIDGGNIKTNTISLERLKSATNNPIIRLFGKCSLDATAADEVGVGSAVRLKWNAENYIYISTNKTDIYQNGISKYTFNPAGLTVTNADVIINSGFLIIGGKKNRGWGFSSGNKYYLGLSGDDTYVRMYNDDVTVANGVTYLGSPSGRYIKVYSTQAADVSSDRRKKTNILSYDEKIEKFYDELKPISYELINGHSGRKHYGFIAQDVEDAMGIAGLDYKDMALLQKAPMDAQGNEIDPTTIVDYSTDERIVDYEYSLAYTEMISINTHMIQKLRAEITQLKKEISEIKGLG